MQIYPTILSRLSFSIKFFFVFCIKIFDRLIKSHENLSNVLRTVSVYFFCFICCIRILHWNCKSVQYIHNEIKLDLSNVFADSFFDKVVRNGHRQEANARIQVQKPPLRKVLLHWGVQRDGQHAGQATAA